MSHQQKEELHKRIKKLEEEIIERTRNYMYQHSLSKSRRKDSVKSHGSQTDHIESSPTSSITPTPKKEVSSSFFNDLVSPQKLIFEGTSDVSPGMLLQERIEAGINEMRKIQNKEQLFEDMTKKLIIISEQNEILRENNEKLQKMVKQISQKVQTQPILENKQQKVEKNEVMDECYERQQNAKIQNLKRIIQQGNYRFKQMEKALLQTQQIDYKLRLTIQSLEHQIKAKDQLMKQMKENMTKRQNELLMKIDQMEVIKKQYLKAYSKMKDEKEALEMHMMETKEGQTLHIKAPLSRITEEEDEHIDEVIRSSNADNSLGAIKNFMERSLIESNRPLMEKWITVSICKLDQLQNENEHKISDIHNSYRNLLRQMADNFKNQMKVLQKQFQSAIKNVVKADIKLVQNSNDKQTKSLNSKSLQRSSSFEFTNSPQQSENAEYQNKTIKLPATFDCNHDPIDSEDLEQRQANWQTLCKISICQARSIGLQDKYDILVHKLAQQSLKESRVHHQFKEMMDKLINFHKAGHQAYELRTNFIEICQKVFSILGNLPTGSHGEVYFVPKDYEELDEALNVLLRFSQSYDKIVAQNIEEDKRKLRIIRKMMEQIFEKKEICFDEMDGVLRKSMTEEDHVISEFMGELIENMKKNRQKDRIEIGNVISFGESSKKSGIN